MHTIHLIVEIPGNESNFDDRSISLSLHLGTIMSRVQSQRCPVSAMISYPWLSNYPGEEPMPSVAVGLLLSKVFER